MAVLYGQRKLYQAILDALAEEYHFSLDTPFQDYPKEIHDIIIYGTGGHEVKVRYKSQRGEGIYDVAFEGLIENVNRRYKETFQKLPRQNMKPICGSPHVRPARDSD